MGTVEATTESGLAGALFTPVQQRVLGLLFGQPERRFQSAELIRLADSGTGAVHRQLQRLESSGLVLATHAGNQKYYQADPKSPIFPELRGLVEKTVGVVEPIRAALEPLADRIVAAFVFGSVAKGTERGGSDLDLLILSDDLEYAEVFATLEPTEARLSRPVHPTVMNRAEWRQKRARHDSFVDRIANQPKLFVIGGESDLA